MATVPHPCVDIHTTPAPQPSILPWFAEIVLVAGYLRGQGLLEARKPLRCAWCGDGLIGTRSSTL